MSQTGDEHVATRLRDPELVEDLEAAAEEHGSKSEAMRNAIRVAYGGGSDDGDEALTGLSGTDLSPAAKKGYRVLRESAGVDEMVEVDAAKSLIAKQTQIPADSVRSMVFAPLKRADLIGVQPHIRASFVVVLPVTAAVDVEGGETDA